MVRADPERHVIRDVTYDMNTKAQTEKAPGERLGQGTGELTEFLALALKRTSGV